MCCGRPLLVELIAYTAQLQGDPKRWIDMEKFEEKMKAAGLSEAAIGAFRLNYEQLVAGVTGLVRLHDPQSADST